MILIHISVKSFKKDKSGPNAAAATKPKQPTSQEETKETAKPEERPTDPVTKDDQGESGLQQTTADSGDVSKQGAEQGSKAGEPETAGKDAEVTDEKNETEDAQQLEKTETTVCKIRYI